MFKHSQLFVSLNPAISEHNVICLAHFYCQSSLITKLRQLISHVCKRPILFPIKARSTAYSNIGTFGWCSFTKIPLQSFLLQCTISLRTKYSYTLRGKIHAGVNISSHNTPCPMLPSSTLQHESAVTYRIFKLFNINTGYLH